MDRVKVKLSIDELALLIDLLDDKVVKYMEKGILSEIRLELGLFILLENSRDKLVDREIEGTLRVRSDTTRGESMFTKRQLEVIEEVFQNRLEIEEDYSGEGYEIYYNTPYVKELKEIYAILLTSKEEAK